MRHINVYVDQPSGIELHVRETVRLDWLIPTADGYVVESHGALLAPGVAQVHLDTGLYHFRTLEEAQLRIIAGGVQVISTGADGIKQPPSSGHGPCGRVPALRVVDTTAGAPEALRTGYPPRRHWWREIGSAQQC